MRDDAALVELLFLLRTGSWHYEKNKSLKKAAPAHGRVFRLGNCCVVRRPLPPA